MASVLAAEISNPRHLGYVSSAAKVYARELGLRAERAAAPEKPKTHFGTIGDRVELELVLVATPGFNTQFGYTTINKMADKDGNLFVWKTSSNALDNVEIGESLRIKGTIAKHSKYQDELQTELKRCVLLSEHKEK